MILVIGLRTFLRAVLCGSAAIALENTALRHQLAVLRTTLVIVQPATVLAWHRQGFQLYWRWTAKI